MTIKTVFNHYKRKTQGNAWKFNTLITVSLGESTTVIWLHGHAVKLFCKSLHLYEWIYATHSLGWETFIVLGNN